MLYVYTDRVEFLRSLSLYKNFPSRHFKKTIFLPPLFEQQFQSRVEHINTLNTRRYTIVTPWAVAEQFCTTAVGLRRLRHRRLERHFLVLLLSPTVSAQRSMDHNHTLLLLCCCCFLQLLRFTPHLIPPRTAMLCF